MILWIARVVFSLSIGAAAITGSATYAPVFLVSGAILFFTDGWEMLVLYGLIGWLGLLLIAGTFF